MRCANLLAVVDTSDAALTRLRTLSERRKKAERAFKKVSEEERAEAIRLLQAEEAGTVAIAAVMERTREAIRQMHNAWKKAHENTASS